MHVKGFGELLFLSFFRWWWAAVTGVASILSLILLPEKIIIGRGIFVGLLFCLLTLVFLCLSVIFQGWILYRRRFLLPRLLRFQDVNEPGASLICLLDDIPMELQGKIAQLKRSMNGVEVPFAVIQFGERNTLGQVHAEILWMSPIHRKDLQANKFGVADVIVDLFMNENSALDWAKTTIETNTGSSV